MKNILHVCINESSVKKKFFFKREQFELMGVLFTANFTQKTIESEVLDQRHKFVVYADFYSYKSTLEGLQLHEVYIGEAVGINKDNLNLIKSRTNGTIFTNNPRTVK